MSKKDNETNQSNQILTLLNLTITILILKCIKMVGWIGLVGSKSNVTHNKGAAYRARRLPAWRRGARWLVAVVVVVAGGSLDGCGGCGCRGLMPLLGYYAGPHH